MRNDAMMASLSAFSCGAIALTLFSRLLGFWPAVEEWLGYQWAAQLWWVDLGLAIGGILFGHVVCSQEQRPVMRWLAFAGLLTGYGAIVFWLLYMMVVASHLG